jgi:hypothetical protein
MLDVPTARGAFTLILDIPSGTPEWIAFDKQYWLEVTVEDGPAGPPYPVTLAPRTELTSAPYALAPWIPNSDGTLYYGGRVAIGTSNLCCGYNLLVHDDSDHDSWIGIKSSSSSGGLGMRVGVEDINAYLLNYEIGGKVGIGSGFPSMFIDYSGNVGIGTSSPDAKLDVNGAIKIVGGNPAPGKVLTSIDESGLARWDTIPPLDGLWKSNGSNIYYNDGNVGIGLSTPESRLHLRESEFKVDWLRDAWTQDGNGPYRNFARLGKSHIYFNYNEASGAEWPELQLGFNKRNQSYTTFSLRLGVLDDLVNGAVTQFYVDEANYMQMGANELKLPIGFRVTGGNVSVTNTTTSSFGSLNSDETLFLYEDHGSGGDLSAGEGGGITLGGQVWGTPYKWAGIYSSRENTLHLDYSASLTFNTAAGNGAQPGKPPERMRLTSAGNLGLGTTNPNGKMEIRNSTNYPTSNTNPTLNLREEAADDPATIQFSSTSSDERWTIAGYPDKDEVDVNSYLGFHYNDNGGNVKVMTMRGDGYVGIGVENPTVALDVNGTIEATGSVRASNTIIVGSAIIHSGTGSPEGVVIGSIGDLYLRTDGGPGTTLYVKETNISPTTGWVAK